MSNGQVKFPALSPTNPEQWFPPPYERQQLALRMLRENPKRDLYEGADPLNTKRGSGNFYVTYSPNSNLVLNRGDIDDLVAAGLIKLKWPRDPEVQFYILTTRGV